MSNPLISVVIPVYNTAPYLEKCLESVVNQTYQNLQVIIINDGSTDNSAEICQKFSEKDDRIEFINKQNEGVSIARNIGIEKSKGEWIYFLDSDDFLEKNTFESLFEQAQENNADIIQFGLNTIKDGKIIDTDFPKTESFENVKDFITNNKMRPLCAWLYFIKANKILENNIYFNEKLKHYEDGLFMYRVLIHCHKIITLNEVYYNQVLSPNSVTRKPKTTKIVMDCIDYVDNLCNEVRKNHQTLNFKNEIVLLSKQIFSETIAIENLEEFQKHKQLIKSKYKSLYKKNHEILEDKVNRLAYINFDLAIRLLKLKHKLRFLKKFFKK